MKGFQSLEQSHQRDDKADKKQVARSPALGGQEWMLCVED